MQSNPPARTELAAAHVLFPGDGEMARRCREMDWAATPLGPVGQWPASLRTAAGMVIAQGIAQALCWGPDLVQVYNDGYRLVMRDKHPAGLGRSVYENWAEIRADIAPLFDRVLGGETVYFEDLPFLMHRDGQTAEAFFTFSYSPVRTESGEVGGALINCFETTLQVQARAVEAERDRLLTSLRFERSRLEYVFQNAPAFLAVFRGEAHVIELANQAFYRLVGQRELMGRPVRETLPEIVSQGFTDLLDAVLRTGAPYVGSEVPVRIARTAEGAEEEIYVDFTYLPMTEADGTRTGIITHGNDVTEQVRARREVERMLRESEAGRRAVEEANARLELQQVELETANVQLQESASELEMQTEELQQAAIALEERTEDAEAARVETERVREHLARVIEQAPVPMYIARGRDHVFEVVNVPYARMVGRRPEELIGRPGREVFPELIAQGVFTIIDRVFDTGVPFSAAAIPAILETGGEPQTHYFNLVYQPLHDHTGEPYAMALVATEVTQLVTERERAEAARREAEAARLDAENANRAKADFLASMSHELRTPLNAIGGYVELVAMGIHGPVTEAQRAALDRVTASQQHLLALINDVLSFAKVEAGQIALRVGAWSAAALLDSVEPLVGPLAAAKQIRLSIGEREDLQVLGDEERARQILLNLVGNAIKFTQAGGWVELSCAPAEGWAEIAVHDNGPGIDPDQQETIFDPFVQVERRYSNPREGVGLGLAISRDLARAMGGELRVASAPGAGSSFVLRLPLARP